MTLVFTAEQAANLRYRGQFDDAQLNPVLLSDGRYGVNEQVLSDPRHALYHRLLRTGTILPQSGLSFGTPDQFEMSIDGKKVYLSAAKLPHAFSVPSTKIYRFETRYNESGYSGDAANNNRRSELVSGEDGNRYGSGETLWQSFSFVVGPEHQGFDAGGLSLNLINQWHSVDTTTSRSPVFGMSLDDGKLRIYTRSDATGTAAQVHYNVTRPTDGVIHNVVVSGLLGSSGHLNVWLDGTQIVNVDTPIGYFNDDGGSRKLAYPHWGLYQNNILSPCVVYIANIEWGIANLADRITTPLSVTTPAVGWI